jgi:hypothetical protein
MADEKQYLSRIRLIDGTTVDIKDQEARKINASIIDRLEALERFVYESTPIDKFDGADMLDAGSLMDGDPAFNIVDLGTII